MFIDTFLKNTPKIRFHVHCLSKIHQKYDFIKKKIRHKPIIFPSKININAITILQFSWGIYFRGQNMWFIWYVIGLC